MMSMGRIVESDLYLFSFAAHRPANRHTCGHRRQQLFNRRSIVRLISDTTAGTSRLLTSLPPKHHWSIRWCRGEACHLGGDCNPDFDSALIVNFLELPKASTKDVIDVGSSVVHSYLRKVSARTHAVSHGVGHELSRINRPSVVIIETDLFRRRLVNKCCLDVGSGWVAWFHSSSPRFATRNDLPSEHPSGGRFIHCGNRLGEGTDRNLSCFQSRKLGEEDKLSHVRGSFRFDEPTWLHRFVALKFLPDEAGFTLPSGLNPPLASVERGHHLCGGLIGTLLGGLTELGLRAECTGTTSAP
jgi:hypothetical protein